MLSFQKHVIEAEIITGNNPGSRVFIPRIMMSPADTKLPFILKRRQFPVQSAFAMTIRADIKLGWLISSSPAFSHRQLYVAFSRITSKRNLKVLITKQQDEDLIQVNYTRNVVYPEIFQ